MFPGQSDPVRVLPGSLQPPISGRAQSLGSHEGRATGTLRAKHALEKAGSVPARTGPKRIGTLPWPQVEQDRIRVAAAVLRIDALAIDEGRIATGKYKTEAWASGGNPVKVSKLLDGDAGPFANHGAIEYSFPP